jgi:hypothetical protein
MRELDPLAANDATIPLPSESTFVLTLARHHAVARNRFILGATTVFAIVLAFLAYTALASPRQPESFRLGLALGMLVAAGFFLVLPHLNLPNRGRMTQRVPEQLSISEKGIEVTFERGPPWLLNWNDPYFALRFDDWLTPRGKGSKFIRVGRGPRLTAEDALYDAVLRAAESRGFRRVGPHALALRSGFTRTTIAFLGPNAGQMNRA